MTCSWLFTDPHPRRICVRASASAIRHYRRPARRAFPHGGYSPRTSPPVAIFARDMPRVICPFLAAPPGRSACMRAPCAGPRRLESSRARSVAACAAHQRVCCLYGELSAVPPHSSLWRRPCHRNRARATDPVRSSVQPASAIPARQARTTAIARRGMVDACVEMNRLGALAHPVRPQRPGPRRGTALPCGTPLACQPAREPAASHTRRWIGGSRAASSHQRGEIAAGFELPLPPVWSGRTVHDAWRGTPAAVHDGVLAATVPVRQAAIFVSRGGQP